jgi:hypothetical protein
MIESSVQAEIDIDVKKKCVEELLPTSVYFLVDLPYQSLIQKSQYHLVLDSTVQCVVSVCLEHGGWNLYCTKQ